MKPFLAVLANIKINVLIGIFYRWKYLISPKFKMIRTNSPFPNYYKLIFFAFFFGFSPHIAFSQLSFSQGTAIFGLATADTIIIGADSRYRSSNDGVFSPPDTTCKIFKERDDVLFAVAGNPVVGVFDMISVGKLACKEGKDFDDVIRLSRILTGHIIGEYVRYMKSTPENRRKFEEKVLGNIGVEYYFVGRTNKKLSVYSFRYIITRNGLKDTVFQELKVQDLPKIGEMPFTIMGGHVQNMFQFAESNQSKLVGNFTKEIIVEAIEKEIALFPLDVGKPIDIFRITKKGIVRLTTERKCKPIQ